MPQGLRKIYHDSYGKLMLSSLDKQAAKKISLDSRDRRGTLTKGSFWLLVDQKHQAIPLWQENLPIVYKKQGLEQFADTYWRINQWMLSSNRFSRRSYRNHINLALCYHKKELLMIESKYIFKKILNLKNKPIL